MPEPLIQALGALIPLPPLVAALWIGASLALDPSPSDAKERRPARIALGAAALSLVAALSLALFALVAGAPGQMVLGTWLASGTLSVQMSLGPRPPGLRPWRPWWPSSAS